MRIALVSTGLGRVLRGFESFTESLFQALRHEVPDLDVVLFQGGGKSGERRVVVPNFHRYSAPACRLGYDRANLLEKRSFALALYPLLRRGGFNIVHYNELTMGSALYHLRRMFGGNFKLLYCDGGAALPMHYRHRCDSAQLLTPPAYEEAIASGIPANRLFLLPYGIDPEAFSPRFRDERARTRQQLGIPATARVVFTAAALDKAHKRLDYLISEVAAVPEPLWLLAAGQRTGDTGDLQALAERKLPGRWRFVSWPLNRVPLLYGAADVFALTSLKEAFGRVIIEAMLSGLPALIHNGPVFGWLAQGTSVHTIDMAVAGALASELKRVSATDRTGTSRAEAVRRFSWESLVPRYLQVYTQIAGPRFQPGRHLDSSIPMTG